MSKPGVFSLSGEAKDFVFGNLPLLRQSIKIIFPLVLLVNAINLAGGLTQHEWVAYVLALPSLYLYACYALTWHRNCLIGVDGANVINPFNIKKTDWKFIGMFLLIMGLLSFYIFCVVFGMGYGVSKFGDGSYPYFGTLSFIALLFGMYATIRAAFFLPAQSVGVTLGLKDVMRSSSHLVWPMIGVIFIYALFFFICAQVYTAILRIVLEVAAHDASVSLVQGGIVSFIGMIPIQLAMMVLAALYTTALSKAYRWGMENNPIA